eukprot:350655-Chlamydomonas_euryale.AAC.8
MHIYVGSTGLAESGMDGAVQSPHVVPGATRNLERTAQSGSRGPQDLLPFRLDAAYLDWKGLPASLTGTVRFKKLFPAIFAHNHVEAIIAYTALIIRQVYAMLGVAAATAHCGSSREFVVWGLQSGAGCAGESLLLRKLYACFWSTSKRGAGSGYPGSLPSQRAGSGCDVTTGQTSLKTSEKRCFARKCEMHFNQAVFEHLVESTSPTSLNHPKGKIPAVFIHGSDIYIEATSSERPEQLKYQAYEDGKGRILPPDGNEHPGNRRVPSYTHALHACIQGPAEMGLDTSGPGRNGAGHQQTPADQD